MNKAMKSTSSSLTAAAVNGKPSRNGAVNHQSNGVSLHSNTKFKDEEDESKMTYTCSCPTLVVTALLTLCPPMGLIFVYCIVELDGDTSGLIRLMNDKGPYGTFQTIFLDHIFGSKITWTIILSFAAFELFLMRILPGKMVKGPITPKGNIPVYKANGFLSFVITVLTYCVIVYTGLFDPSLIYDNFIDIIGGLTLTSLIFVLVLYIKGRFAPSSSDHSVSGNFLFDYFWGTELYPRIFGWDIKMFTNCRFGLMAWTLLLITYAFKQHSMGTLSDSLIVSIGIQLVYLAKFYHWEMGYMKSLDIMHDRAGFYICWGCLVWVPSVYTSHSLYLVKHPNQLGLPLAAFIFLAGVLMVYINYDADRQRELVRNTNGKCLIWGKPPKLIHATYKTTEGVTKKSILLVSGWWGVARHFHYLPELAAAFLWSVPALFESPLPYFYFVMLFILLTHRSIRDDKRCKEKYGVYWKSYCSSVPYRMLPYVF